MLCRGPTVHYISPFYQLSHEIEALFEAVQSVQNPVTPRTVRPNFVSRRNEEGTSIDIELPGVEPQDISVEVKDGILNVRGKRLEKKVNIGKDKPDTEDKDETDKEEQREQKPTLLYELRVRLGRSVDEERIEAQNAGNGILRIIVPIKKAEVKKINIA